MLGGFVTSVIDEGQVYSVKKDIDPELAFAAFVPDFRLLTSKARAALPAMVSHKDAVYNLSRARWPRRPSARATTRYWVWRPRTCCTRSTACR